MLSTNMRPELSEDEIRARIAAVPFWFHQIELAPGIVTPGYDRSQEKLPQLQLPDDLTGKRVLDIGAFDGYLAPSRMPISSALNRHPEAKAAYVPITDQELAREIREFQATRSGTV